MKDTKRRVEFFSFYDHTGIERHLSQMAEKGWLLEKIGNFTWHYRRIEPQRLAFSVSYFPQASLYDPRPSDKQEMFYDFCAHNGWTLAAASAQMQIFYNERPNPVPIDTDPVLEVDAIHQSMKKGYLVSQALLAGAAVLNLIVLISSLVQDPIQALCDSSTLLRAVCWPMILLVVVIDTGTYFLWRHRARKAAEQGEFLATNSHPWFQKILLVVVLAWFGWWVSTLTSGLAMVVVASVAGALAIVALVVGIRDVLKEKNASAGTNKAITIALCITLPILLTMALPFFVINGMGYDRDAYTTDSGEPPLQMEDLMDTGTMDYTVWDMANESPLLARYYADLYPEHRTHGEARLGLYYTVIVVKAPALYNLCRQNMLDEYGTRSTGQLPVKYYAPVDPAPWGADEAYQLVMEDDELGPLYRYLLCYPDRIVLFKPDWEPTRSQMAVVAEKLGGV